MIGAIAGDMVGSPYEVHPITHKSFDIVVSAFIHPVFKKPVLLQVTFF